MKKRNTSDAAYDAHQLMLAFVNPEEVNASLCTPSPEVEHLVLRQEIRDCEEAILDWEGMLSHFLDLKDASEASFCRRMMQQTRVQKRRLKARMLEIEKSLMNGKTEERRNASA